MINEKYQKIIFVIIILVICVYMIITGIKNNKLSLRDRLDNAEYTIGILDGWHIPIKQSVITIGYKYSAHNQLLEGKDNLPNSIDLKDVNTEGGKYIVRFSRKDLENAEILFELGEVPDSIADEALEYKLYWDSIPKW